MKFINYIFYSLCAVLLFGILWFKPKAFVVQSGSMEPAIKTGSLIITVPQKAYESGNVITFRKNEETITHRLMYIRENEYLTAGDANEEFDLGTINKSQVIGKVIFNIPYMGYILPAARDPKWFIFLVVVPATIIIYEELKFLLGQIKKSTGDSPLAKQSILIPVIGVGIVFVSISAAYFTDYEKSSVNTLGAASTFGEKTAQLYSSDEYTCEGGAANLASPQAKIAVFEKTDGNIKVIVKLEGATPFSTYDIWINQYPVACPLSQPTEIAAITTDALGNGLGDTQVSEASGAIKFWISAVGGGQVLRSTSVSF